MIALDKFLVDETNFTPDGGLAAFSPLNPKALRLLLKTWIEGLRRAGLDISDAPAAAD